MADEKRNVGGNERLPIKLIMPKQGTERRVPGGGTPPAPFRTVDGEYRKRLSNQIGAAREAVLPQLSVAKAVPVRVKILAKAAAKSHRPEKLFSEQSCPIIGAGRLGELFIKATADGLTRLNELIEHNTSDRITKELSCIESIEAITPALRRRGLGSDDILRRSPRRRDKFITRVRLFNFGADDDHPALVAHFKAACATRGIKLDQTGYAAHSFTYAAECQTVADVEALSRIVGVRSIAHMPLVRTIRPRMLNQQTLPALPTRDPADSDVPVVVVVDGGITDQMPALNSWVMGRIKDVSPPYDKNTDHGTFVAGLVCWGHELNPTVAGLDAGPCAVFDLQVIPNDDPARGDTSALLESELLSSLETALQQHANKYKVWNLSLGTDSVCSLDEFSELAEQLDNLQEKYQVSFVISAGNYQTLPLLDFPRTPAQMDAGRITSPADSVLGITVGSVSHVDYRANGPKLHHPSAFSRHGAGPNYIIKPDLVHYGGSCSTDTAHVHGIRSVTDAGLAEDLGTSYATPLVSRTLAQIYHQITPTPTPVLARALLTHHARDPRSGTRVPDGEENFLGFGLPAVVPYCLECTPHTATLVFDDTLRPGYFLEWDDFPYPPSLRRNGRFFGEVWMTLAFAPARGARWGTEYCETHIDAHLGVYFDQVSRDTGEIKQKFKGLVPPEHRNPGLLYEAYQVEKLRKWAPVRTYHGHLGENGERGSRWRLMLRLLTRHGIEDEAAFKPQPFSLIITIADPEKKASVYDEMAQIVRNRFQAQNMSVRTRARVRGKT
ncbi:MAG: S8 family serine peptidase [Burkholderiales bacterium]|nr:S8 family serine peptidase [Burkholderiales bacterium]